MKRFFTLLGVLLLLAGCTNEGSNEGKQEEKASTQETSASSLHIKPAKLSKREQSIVNQMGIDFKTFYTVDGTVGEGEALVTSIVVYKDGEDGKKSLLPGVEIMNKSVSIKLFIHSNFKWKKK